MREKEGVNPPKPRGSEGLKIRLRIVHKTTAEGSFLSTGYGIRKLGKQRATEGVELSHRQVKASRKI